MSQDQPEAHDQQPDQQPDQHMRSASQQDIQPLPLPEVRIWCRPGMEAGLSACLESLSAWPREAIRIYANPETELPADWQERLSPLAPAEAPQGATAWAPVLAAPRAGWCLFLLGDELIEGWDEAAWIRFSAEASGPLGFCRRQLRGWLDLQARLIGPDAAELPDPEGPPPTAPANQVLAGLTITSPERPDTELEAQLQRLEAAGQAQSLPLRARLLQALGRLSAARSLLAARLEGAAQSTRIKGIRVFRRPESDEAGRLQVARLLLALEDPDQAPQFLLQRLQSLLQTLPALEASPESWALKAEIAWRMGQEAVAAACASQALSAGAGLSPAAELSALGWLYRPLDQGLPQLRLAQLDLLQGREADALSRLEAAEAALAGRLGSGSPQSRLQLSYADFVAAGGRQLAGRLRQQEERYGLATPLLRLLVAALGDEPLEQAALTELLERPPGGSFERLVLYRLLQRSALTPPEREALLRRVLARAAQPEWTLSLGEALLAQGRRAEALTHWRPLVAQQQTQRLPAGLLGELAAALADLGERALARRCLERNLVEDPQNPFWREALARLLQAYVPFGTAIRLLQAPDWAQGGDLALKLCLESFSDHEGILIQVPGDWAQPVLRQALGWAHQQLAPEATPVLWCGELPAGLEAARSLRLAPWRRPDGSGALAEIQPQPQSPAEGPVYVICRDPEQQALWLEPDPASLRRWLRAGLAQELPPRPAVTALRPPPARVPIALLLSRHGQSQGLSELAANFAAVRQPAPGQSWREALPEQDWIFWLDPDERIDPAYLPWLGELVSRLEPEIRAVALGGLFPGGREASGPWPACRLLRRSALAGFDPALAVPLTGPDGSDARICWQPDIPILLSPTGESPLTRAWQALRAGQQPQPDRAAWPGSQRYQASCRRLELEYLALQAQWKPLLQAVEAPELGPLARAWFSALARRRLGQDAQAALSQALRLADQLACEPEDLLPPIPRAQIAAELGKA